jgi:hypothetical protein
MVEHFNPTHGSGWMVSDPFYKTTPKFNLIPPTAVGGYFRSLRKYLNNPPTTVGGIHSGGFGVASRKDLNEPPTAVGGISDFAKPPLTASRLNQ